jgi:HIT zinc finger
MEANPDAIPAPKSSVPCQICTADSAKYTCPRCGFKTCSLDCSKAHKIGTTADAGCSGIKENNAGGFVAMNSYGYSAFVNDYVFLEEVGRNISVWGRDIQEKKLLGGGMAGVSNGRGKGARMIGRGNRKDARGGKGRSKREVLRDMLLERADVDIQLCPEGMERRKMNQSSWDTKYVISFMRCCSRSLMRKQQLCRTNTGYLTIQYRLHQANNLATSNHDRQAAPSTKRKNMSDSQTGDVVHLLTHRNNIETSLKDSLRRMVEERSKNGTQPSWVREMIIGKEARVIQEQDGSGGTLGGYVVLLRGSTGPLEKGVRVVYERLDTEVALVEALRGHSFVEFPTLEVIRERERSEVGREWGPNDKEKEGESDESEEEDQEVQDRTIKRRKIDEEAGKRLLERLQVYGEDDGESDSDPRADLEKKPTGLLGMLDYSSDSSEASELEDMETAPVQAGKTALDLGEEEEVDWDDE